MNLLSASVAHWAAIRPGQIALTMDAGDAMQQWTYAELDDRIRRSAAGLLAAGVCPGDRVVVALPNGPAFVFAFFGVIAAGGVAVPASVQLTHRELAFLILDSGAVMLIGDHAVDAACAVVSAEQVDHWKTLLPAPLCARDADDPAWLLYTSGTTGEPKGVLHAHRTLRGRAPMRGNSWLDLKATDRLLHAGALNWSYTLGVGLLDCWAEGAESVLYTGAPDPVIWTELIRRHRCTLFAAVPSVYRRLLKYGAFDAQDCTTLRHAVTAGESLSPVLHQQWRDRTGVELFEALGMSECSTYVSSGPAVPVRSGWVGRPQRGRRIAVLDDDGQPIDGEGRGLLAVHRSDPGLMLGYWHRPEEESQVLRGEWFVGGDLVERNADGYLRYLGRANDLMNASGYRVSPLEVEQVIAMCTGVADVAVTECLVGDDVRVIGALVVAEQGPVPAMATLQQQCEIALAAYKRPRLWQWVDELPRNRNGKLRRGELESLFRDQS